MAAAVAPAASARVHVVDYRLAPETPFPGAPRDPRCSAIFADMHGFPPMLIQVGENEILYDDATRIRDAATTAGVDVAFESWRHGVHVWPVFISAGLPESAASKSFRDDDGHSWVLWVPAEQVQRDLWVMS